MLKEQQSTISDLLAEQKRELFEKVEDSKSKHRFCQRHLEQQYEVNHNFLKLANQALSCIDKGYVEKARDYLQELEGGLLEHEEDLIAVDLRCNGWLTVQRIRNKGVLSSSLLKKLENEDDSIYRRKKKPYQDGGPVFRSAEVDRTSLKSDVRTFRPAPKKSPEQLLSETVKQTQAGQCTFCHEEGHFCRECPLFWEKVCKSRKANIKN